MAATVKKLVPVIDFGVMSLNSKFQPCSFSNGLDINIEKSKMATIVKPAKPDWCQNMSQ